MRANRAVWARFVPAATSPRNPRMQGGKASSVTSPRSTFSLALLERSSSFTWVRSGPSPSQISGGTFRGSPFCTLSFALSSRSRASSWSVTATHPASRDRLTSFQPGLLIPEAAFR